MVKQVNWPTGSFRIFISYAREDAAPLALRLYNDLRAAGQDAWLDTAEIGVGATWAADIEEAIENCDLMLALLSHASYISPTCRAEQARGLRKQRRIIPVLVQPDADRPLELETLNYVDLSDEARYEEAFSNLMTAITTGYLPPNATQVSGDTQPVTPYLPPREKTQPIKAINLNLKRDANGFRRYLEDLRGEPWLGERHWWTYFLFYYADVTDIVPVLQGGTLKPRSEKARHGSWDHTVRLYFRPRTPELFGCEGIRPVETRPSNHCAVPVYLLFDLEAVVSLAEVRFSEGDLMQKPKTFRTAASFREMPFDRIYHDTWFRPEERDEVLFARRAQVVVPHPLDLQHVRHIWCRSTAEYETLYHLLPDDTRRIWGDKITVRQDYHLFHSKWPYVERAALSREGALFHFNPCGGPDPEDCGPFEMRVEIQADDGQQASIDLGEMMPDEDLALDLTTLKLRGGFGLRLYLDDALAYAGRYTMG